MFLYPFNSDPLIFIYLFLFLKVGIWIANDAQKISNDYNVCVEPLEDLSSLANLKLGVAPKQWSLASLTEFITCKQVLQTTCLLA